MTREEAIERIKSRYDKWALDDKDLEAIQCTFPELAESEDEKIRKELLAVINDLVLPDEQNARFNAWLEKQKYDRMKPIYDARESFESALEKAWNDYHNGYENVDKLEDDYVECAHAKGFREGYLFGIEKQKEPNLREFIDNFPYSEQKEQKPVDLVAELKLHLANTPKEQLEKEWKELEPYGNIGPTVHEFLYGEQPAEWSEDIIRKAVKEVGLTQHQIDWFEANVFPPKQEWSEADEVKIHFLKALIQNQVRDCDYLFGHNGKDYVSKQEAIEMLSSLRSSWKPSEEQMEAFRKYLEDFQARAEAAVGGWNNFDVMIRLYEQLKKLI